MKLALSLLIIPGLLVVSSYVILLVINLIFNPTFWMTPDTEQVAATPFYITALNKVFITIGGIGIVSIFPGLITSVYLFASQKRSISKNVIS